MNAQLYTAASGLVFQERRVEAVSNNLANISTHGYRARRLFAAEFAGGAAGGRVTNRPVALAGDYLAPGTGIPRVTGRSLDVALTGDALLVVDTPAGRRYTRDGALALDSSGRLVDAGGRPVLGEGGEAIEGLPPGVSIDATGAVHDDSGATFGRLLVVAGPWDELLAVGGDLFAAPGADDRFQPLDDPELTTASLELSGAQPMEELIRLLEAQRAFETYTRLASLTDQVNRRTVNDLAR